MDNAPGHLTQIDVPPGPLRTLEELWVRIDGLDPLIEPRRTVGTEDVAPQSPGDDLAVDRYRRLIERSGVGLFETQVDGRIVWLNAAAARLVGYDTPDEFLQKVSDIREIYVDPQRRDELLAILDRDEAVSGFEYEMKRSDGARRWISITANALRNAADELEGFEGTFVDITERKLIESATSAISSNLEPSDAVARFGEVVRQVVPFRQLSLLVIEGDHYRRVVSIAATRETSPLYAGQLVPLAGNSVEFVVETATPVVVQDTSEGRYEFDDRLAEAGVGSYTILPLEDDSGVFATFNVGLAEKNALDPETASILAALSVSATHAVRNILLFERQRAVVEQLEAIARLKDEFFAHVSHDLRNPVAVMCGVAEMLEKKWERLSDENKRQMLTSLLRNGQTVQRLLKRDLDMALIELGEIKYESAPFDLPHMVREVVEMFDQSGADRVFRVELPDAAPPARGDEARCSQVLYNLLSNAVKFSERGSAIDVRVASSDGFASVSVADEGPGVPVERRDQLFQRLSRLDPTKPGTGIGLYMARSMVEAQGGAIAFEPGAAGGSCFTFTLPLAETTEEGA